MSAIACSSAPTSIHSGGKAFIKKLGENIFEVRLEGSGMSTRDHANQMLILRSSELSFDKGFRYFIVLKEKESWEGLVVNHVLSEGNKAYTLEHTMQLLHEPIPNRLNYDAYAIYYEHLKKNKTE